MVHFICPNLSEMANPDYQFGWVEICLRDDTSGCIWGWIQDKTKQREQTYSDGRRIELPAGLGAQMGEIWKKEEAPQCSIYVSWLPGHGDDSHDGLRLLRPRAEITLPPLSCFFGYFSNQ